MLDKKQILNDVFNDIIRLNKPEIWKAHDKRDDVIRKLRFISSSLHNINVEHLILDKVIDAFIAGHSHLAYSLMYSNNRLYTQEEDILIKKFNNAETNFCGRIKLLIDR